MGRDSLQRDERIAMIYSQCSGLADFFMQADSGRHRDGLIRYIAMVYAGRANPRTLAETTGTSYEALDAAYRAFLSAGVDASQPATQAAR